MTEYDKDIKKVYGPYTDKRGRKLTIIHYMDGTKRSISHPKYLMEQHLGRRLTDDETVDHIDRDFTNDDISNLRIINRSDHAKDDAIYVDDVEFECAWCGEISSKKARDIHHHSRQGKAGPFCSKSCAGKYGKSVQMGSNKLPVQPEIPKEDRDYFYKDKD